MTKIQSTREEKGISREEMATKLNISFYTVKSYETGTRQPPVTRLKQIAEILGTTIDNLA